MNVASIVGRLTAKPELRHTNNGKAVTSFSVAIEDTFKDADGNAVVDYIDCVAWNNQAEFLCKWFDKGVRVGLTGKLKPRRYEKDGQTHKVTEVLVSTVEFADGKRTTSTPANNTNDDFMAPDTNDDFVPLESGDELPF
jgi:single-strand DNA-binding protein